MIAAAIDIGTNSVKITAATRDTSGALVVLLDKTQTTRLGGGVDKTGALAEDKIEKTLAALTDFAAEAKAVGASIGAAVGTSALRDARNGAEFLEKAKAILGVPVQVVSGDREAELIYTAVRRDPLLASRIPPDALLVVTDIGGGSTEIIIGRGKEITFRQSLQIGAVRLTERIAPTDPPLPEEIGEMQTAAAELLASVPHPSPGENVFFIGCGGTATNLLALSQGGTSSNLHGATLTQDQLGEQITRLVALPLAERRALPGLDPARADVILAGAIIQATLLTHFQTPTLTLSLQNLRYGLLQELLP